MMRAASFFIMGVTFSLLACQASAGLLNLGAGGRLQRQLYWGSGSSRVFDESLGGLPYSTTTGSSGAFAQLIWVGLDGAKDPFDPGSPDGTGGDDVVVDISYSYGKPWNIGTKSNQFASIGVPVEDVGLAQDGSNYYVRVYNGANPNYGVGSSPITGVTDITYYWESGTHSYNDSETEPDDWNFTGGTDKKTDTQIQPVPEPTTMGLMAVGALALVGARRRRRS